MLLAIDGATYLTISYTRHPKRVIPDSAITGDPRSRRRFLERISLSITLFLPNTKRNALQKEIGRQKKERRTLEGLKEN
jgi:hypothetical protein